MPRPRPSPKPSKSFASISRTRWSNRLALVFAKLEKLKPGAAQLAAVWQEIEAAEAQTSSKPPEVVEEVFGREDEFLRGIESHSASRAAFEELFKVPVRPAIQRRPPMPHPAE